MPSRRYAISPADRFELAVDKEHADAPLSGCSPVHEVQEATPVGLIQYVPANPMFESRITIAMTAKLKQSILFIAIPPESKGDIKFCTLYRIRQHISLPC